jgi:hypothetical protein
MGMSAMVPQAAPQQPPTRMAYGGQVAVSNNQVPSPAMERGISGLPVPDNMFDYADGGMIAFAGGGDVPGYFIGGNPYKDQWMKEAKKRNPNISDDLLEQMYDRGVRSFPTADMSSFTEAMKQQNRVTGAMLPDGRAVLVPAQPLQREGAVAPSNAIQIPDAAAGLRALQRPGLIGPRPDMPIQPGSIVSSRGDEPYAVNLSSKTSEAKPQEQTQANKEAVKQAVATTGLSSTVPSLPPARSGQTGDFAVSPEERARGLVSMAGLPKPEAMTDEAALERIRAIEEKSGVDPKFFEKLQSRIDTMREEARTDKKEAANLRLLEAGLGILGGTSPYAFVNIGKGASEAVKGFGQDLKDYQKARRELDKSEMELKSAEQTAARTKSATALNMVERRQDKVDAAKTKEAELYSTAVNSFYQLDEKAKSRISGENISMAQLQARREEVIAQIAAQDRQIAESAKARSEATKLQFGAKVASDLERAISNAAKPFDEQREILIKSIPFGMAYPPEVVKALNDLADRRAKAIDVVERRYLSNVSKNTSGNNRFPGFVDLTDKQ